MATKCTRKAREVRQTFRYDLRGYYKGLYLEPNNSSYRFVPAAPPCKTEEVAATLECDENLHLTFIKVWEDENGEAGYTEDILENEDANDPAKIEEQMNDPHTIAVIAEYIFLDYSDDENGITNWTTRVWTYDSQSFWLLATPDELEYDIGIDEPREAELFVHRDKLNECDDCKFCDPLLNFRCTKMDKEIGRDCCRRHNCALFMRRH